MSCIGFDFSALLFQVRIAQDKGANAVIVALLSCLNMHTPWSAQVCHRPIFEVDRKTSSLTSEDIQKTALPACIFAFWDQHIRNVCTLCFFLTCMSHLTYLVNQSQNSNRSRGGTVLTDLDKLSQRITR